MVQVHVHVDTASFMYTGIDTCTKYNNVIHVHLGVEKNNDVAKHCYYSSNKHDPCGEVMRTEKRQEALQTFQREKGKYTKRDIEYWTSGIKEQRAKKPRH